jgi:peptidyl-prolyl cis-trans isomerase SurA
MTVRPELPSPYETAHAYGMTPPSRFALALAAALVWLTPAAIGVGGGGGGGEAAAQSLRIAAVVNDDVISERDLVERLRLVAVTSGIAPTAENQRRLAPQVLRGLIQEALQLQEARRLNVTVQAEEIDRALASIAQQNNMPPERMLGILRTNGVGEATLRRQLEAQIAWLKVIARQIRPRVSVTPEQIDQAVSEQARAGSQPEYLLSEILLPVDDPSQDEAAARDAQRLAEALRGGASFEALAQQFSASGSGGRVGDIGWVPAPAIPPELRPTIESLAPGEVSPPVRSNAGYHLFLLRDRRTPSGGGGEDGAPAGRPEVDRERIAERLEEQQIQRLARRYLRDLRADAFIDVRL